MGKALSREIAEEIRQRIKGGTLRVGDRVPSARQIVKEWGVALATATKVLAALREEGLVRAVPGVGTVVAPETSASPPARRVERELSVAGIVACSISIADRHGLAALSMRAVAAELGAPTMSLYSHVRGKEALIALMVDAVFAEAPLPPASGGWRARLQSLARLQWALGRRHPWLAQVLSITRPQPSPSAMMHTEWSMQALAETGIETATAIQITVTLVAYVIGIALGLESEARAADETGLGAEEWMETQAGTYASITSTGAMPLLARVTSGPSIPLDLPTLFEFGLERLLDGVEVLLARRGGALR